MPNQYPLITRNREEPLPHLGWPWEMAMQVEDSTTNEIQSRVFNVLDFSEAEVALVNEPPPDYPANGVATAYYRVSRTMTQTKWVGLKQVTNDVNNPAYALNNFQGWTATPYEYAMDSWYLDLVYRTITWQPKLTDWTHPTTGVVSQVPTNQYELLIKDGEDNLVSSEEQGVSTTELVIALDSSSWGAMRTQRTGTAAAYLTISAEDTATSNEITGTKRLITQSHLRLIKPAATYNAGGGSTPPSLSNDYKVSVAIYGVLWFGDVRFQDNIGASIVHMHPAETPAEDLLKPPGLNSLSTDWDTLSYAGTGTLALDKAMDIGVVS